MSQDSGQTAASGAPARHADSQPGAGDTAQTSASPEDDAKAILAEAESKAQEILAAAEEARERLSSEVLASAEGTALEITAEARRRAEAIVKEGQAKVDEALAEAERNRARIEQERSLLEVKLDELLRNAFEEVRRPTERPLRSVDDLSEASEVREAAGDSK